MTHTNWFNTDTEFNALYPAAIRKFAGNHFTPLSVARTAADFLVTGTGVRILDIGSGAGKFCFAAACHKPEALFFGIEQRHYLFECACRVKDSLGFSNVSFIHGNFTQLDLSTFDHLYLYNPFYENLSGVEKLDDSIEYSEELFDYYHRYLFLQLEKMPPGNRLASFHAIDEAIPPAYCVVGSSFDNRLKLWIKV